MSGDTTAARRRQIMNAVVDVTVAGGLQAATFRTIAEQAGVSVRLVQYYFGDKDRLLADTLAFVRADIAALVAAELAELGSEPEPRDVVQTICEAFLPVDERRRRAMVVFIVFGTAALTDASLRAPDALRQGGELAEVLAEQLRRVRSDAQVDDDALLLVTTIVGVGNGVLAGDLTVGPHPPPAGPRRRPGPARSVTTVPHAGAPPGTWPSTALSLATELHALRRDPGRPLRSRDTFRTFHSVRTRHIRHRPAGPTLGSSVAKVPLQCSTSCCAWAKVAA